MVPAVMGILNVTPDSFSDGGRFLDPDAAVAHGRAMVEEGAVVVDVGGESTRPGAEPVDPAEEARRVVPVVEALAPLVRVSVDTRHASVAEAAIEAGATLVNDVSASLWEVAAAAGVGWVAGGGWAAAEGAGAGCTAVGVADEFREVRTASQPAARTSVLMELMMAIRAMRKVGIR